jgi:nucleoside 2-deoxyribosyltransferase
MDVFVMMPYQEDFKPVRNAIKKAAGQVTAGRVTCIWADEITRAGAITEQMMDEIRKSVICIADVTGQNPNVALEIGYAQALGKPVITLAQSSSHLFFDLKDQRTIIYDPKKLSATLVHQLTTWLEQFPDAAAHPEDLVGTERHERTSLALMARRVSDTPYTFFDLFSRAKKHIFIAAQNHFFLTERTERQELLRTTLSAFLSADRSRRVDIMLCNITDEHAVRTWTYVAGESAYESDLRVATEFFETLDRWAKQAPFAPDQLTIRRVTFVPFSISFVDPEDDRGAFLVLTPNAYQPENRARPCFVLSKQKNFEIFDAYWSSYHHRFISREARESWPSITAS